MKFSDRPPSSDWAPLKYKGEPLAEAWFKPDGDPLALVFRVPRGPARLADVSGRLTVETLLRAVAVAGDEVESWRFDPADSAAAGVAESELKRPLPPPPPDAPHLTIHIRFRPPAAPAEVTAAPANGQAECEVPPGKWNDLDARWQAVLNLEAGIGATRLSVEAARAELETASRKSLTAEEKQHALQADVSQWTKAKSRIHFTLPKLREFVHRATWATAVPERKRLEQIVKDHIEPRVPFPGVDGVREELEHLQKDRQVLAAQGNAVLQEGRGLASEVQRALSSLQRNAADRARAKRNAGGKRGF